MSGNPKSYTLSIDWKNQGTFPDSGDTAKLRGYRISRGRKTTFMGDVKSGNAKLARNEVGTLTLTLDNEDGRYDTHNALSPLYPNVFPGGLVRLSVTDDLSNTYVLFTGRVDDIRTLAYRHDARVEITCSDYWKKMSQNPISSAMYTNKDLLWPMREIVFDIYGADPLGLSEYSSGVAMSNGSDIFPYIWGNEDTPYQVLHDFTEMEGGYCWINTTGYFHFLSRANALTQTPAFNLDQSQVLDEPQVSQPWDDIINIVNVGVHDRTMSGTPTNQPIVWQTAIGVAPLLATGQVVHYKAYPFSGTNGKDVPITSYWAFYFQLNTKPDGTGANITQWSFAQLKPPGGAVAIWFRIQNNDVPAYLVYLKLTANPLDDLHPAQAIAINQNSANLFGQRALNLDYPYMQGILNATNVANYYLSRFKTPAARFTVEIVNRSTIQFAYELNTLMNFTSSYLSKQNIVSAKLGGGTAVSTGIPVIAWNNPSDALAEGGGSGYTGKAYASFAHLVANTTYTTQYLQITNFGFNFKSTDTITGVLVRVKRGALLYSVGLNPNVVLSDLTVQLIKGGILSGNNYAKSDAWLTTSQDNRALFNVFYGGNDDLWNVALSYSDVNANNFGIAIAVQLVIGNTTPDNTILALIDYVEMTVYTNNGAFRNAFRIVGIQHETGQSPYEVKTTWTLEPTTNSSGLLSPNQTTDTPHAGELFPTGGGVTY